MKNIINLIVKDIENGQRVDQFISNNKKISVELELKI